MISKTEILSEKNRTGLDAHIIEKDYVLGWMLAGIFNHHKLKNKWIFKGGTCLKKCHFENYRFSEDLDFTITDSAHIDINFLTDAFKNIAVWVYEHTGIHIPTEKIDFEIYDNKAGTESCQGKLSYAGPLSPSTAMERWPRIKLDLTAHELLVEPAHSVKIYHPYSDEPKDGILVLTYSYEEIFAEKIRALGERTRPRDLYDVINLFQQSQQKNNNKRILSILREKCDFKKIDLITQKDIEQHRESCEAGWQDQLIHQVNSLPNFHFFWDKLPNFFDWLHN